jgi:hypothetical protein
MRAASTSRAYASKSWNDASRRTTGSTLIVHGMVSMTSHSTAFFSSTLSTVNTLFTVFVALPRSVPFRRWTSSFLIASSFREPSAGMRCMRRIVSLEATPLGFCRLASACSSRNLVANSLSEGTSLAD